MRLTVCHCDPALTPASICDCPDLEVSPGLTIAQLRHHATHALDDRTLATAAFWAGGRQLPAHAVIGQPPLTHGSRVHTAPDDEHPLLRSGRALTGAHRPILRGPDTGWLMPARRRRSALPIGRRPQSAARQAVRPRIASADVAGLLGRSRERRSPRRQPVIGAAVAALVAVGIGIWTGNLMIAAMSGLGLIPVLLGGGLLHRRGDRRLSGLIGHSPSDLLTRLLLRDQDPSIEIPAPEPDALVTTLASHVDIAIVGTPSEREATARLLICRWAEHAPPAQVTIDAALRGLPQWRWTRWLSPASRGPSSDDEPPSTLHVSSATGTASSGHGGRPSSAEHRLCLVDSEHEVPAWCRVIVNAGTGSVRIGHHTFSCDLTYPGVAWADDVARLLAASGRTSHERSDALSHASAATAGPVSLLHTVGAPGPDDGLDDWLDHRYARDEHSHGQRGLTATIGVDAAGRPVTIDLGRDGPHGLIAGTTGAGKSQLLQTLIHGLALNARSDELALVLVDYKGGTSLGRCRDLPHVIGEVTDLDRSGALRALTGLRAEVQRREAAIAAAGVTDIGEYTTLREVAAMPRIVVVVDEFRAMADDLPEFMPELLTIAAQGRSLGIHLILATQRPAGAIGPEIRANVALRLCLRVTDDSESHDVIGTHLAARLSPSRPGQLYLRSGQEPVFGPVQTALSSMPPQEADAVRLAPYLDATPEWELGMSMATPDITESLVAAIDAHHRRHGISRTPPPWGDPLPHIVSRREAHQADRVDPAPAGAIPLAVTDHPEIPCHRAFMWSAGSATLVVAGPAGSGKTTAVRGVVQAAGDATPESVVHVISVGLEQGLELWRLAQTAASGARPVRPGSVATAREGALLATVLGWLTFEAVGDHLVVIDDADVVLETLERERLSAVADQLLSLIRQPPPGVKVVTAWTRAPRAVIERASTCLELWGNGADSLDPRVPRDISAGARVPGRCLAISGDTVAVGQVLLPDGQDAGHVAALPHWRPLPAQVSRAECLPDTIGVLGFSHDPLRIDLTRPLLVSARRSQTLHRAVCALLERYGKAATRCVVSAQRMGPEWLQPMQQGPCSVEVVQPGQLQVSDVTDPETLVVVLGNVASLGYEVQQALGEQMAARGSRSSGPIVALTSAELMSGYGEPMTTLRQMPQQLHFAPYAPELGDLIPHEDRHLLAPTSRPPAGRALYVDGDVVHPAQVALPGSASALPVTHSGGATGLSRAVMAG